MADTSDSAKPTVELDEEGKRLQLQAEKAKYRRDIAQASKDTATARSSSLSDLVPDIADAPKGDVTLGDDAGAYGPWLAHLGLENAAKGIADAVAVALGEGDHRLLVVENASLMTDDWAWGLTKWRMEVLEKRLSTIPAQVEAARSAAQAALQSPSQPASAPVERGGHQGFAPNLDAGTGREEASLVGGEPGIQPGAAISGAVDLFSLLRTDYGLTATKVATSSSELAVLTAAALADKARFRVELDGFMLVPSDTMSPTLRRLSAIVDGRADIASRLAELDRVLAIPTSELVLTRSRIERLEQAWTTEASAATPKPDALAKLDAEIERLVVQQRDLDRICAPASAVAAFARQAVTDTDGVIGGLLETSEGHEPPLKIALTRERLHSPAGQALEDAFTHVLYVHLDEAKGDVVTRRSIIGTSGRLSFLAGVNTSWLLFDVAGRAIKAGGPQENLQRMLFDLETAQAERGEVKPDGNISSQDRLLKLENWAKAAVVAVAFFLIIIAVLGIINLIFS